MDCMECKDNYLKYLFQRCLGETNVNTDEALKLFDKRCTETGDPRSSLRILHDMVENSNCVECKEYKKYYEEMISKVE